ncbi:MAG TPA: hypothetical protein VK730_04665 [Solirubrobacteraceae bacterium]|jgi:hypothetical protein|nr:hypothetical protein [Solirubrobacteraceae bacterium]
MKKSQILGAMLLAVCAFSAVAASGASAHEWLTLAGAKVTKAEEAKFPGSFALHNRKIPALFGGGELTMLCMYESYLTVDNNSNVILLITNLTGGEIDKVKCEVSTSTNSICKAGTSVTVSGDNLAGEKEEHWNGELILSGTSILDDITAPEGGKEVGYTVTCNSINNLCGVTLETAKFKKNESSGAVLTFNEEHVATCTVGEGTLFGEGTVLGFLVN